MPESQNYHNNPALADLVGIFHGIMDERSEKTIEAAVNAAVNRVEAKMVNDQGGPFGAQIRVFPPDTIMNMNHANQEAFKAFAVSVAEPLLKAIQDIADARGVDIAAAMADREAFKDAMIKAADSMAPIDLTNVVDALQGVQFSSSNVAASLLKLETATEDQTKILGEIRDQIRKDSASNRKTMTAISLAVEALAAAVARPMDINLNADATKAELRPA